MAKKELKKLEIKIDELEQLQRSLWKYQKKSFGRRNSIKKYRIRIKKNTKKRDKLDIEIIKRNKRERRIKNRGT